jgi:AcrR family transcriptional regulator
MAQYIAEVAARLFYREGVHAVGVDRVADTAELTKRTIYRHYRSKDELIAGAIRYAPRVPFPESGPPVERMLGAFAALETFLTDVDYRGCPYIIFSAELAERDHPARTVIDRYLGKRRGWFRDRAAEAGLRNPERVAEELDVLFDGAVASGAKRGDLVAVRTAQRVARMVLRDAAIDGAVASTRGRDARGRAGRRAARTG